MGYNAIANKSNVNVEIPSWRADILHDIDIAEDVAVGFGFDKFEDFSGALIHKPDAAILVNGNDTVIAGVQILFIIGCIRHLVHLKF